MLYKAYKQKRLRIGDSMSFDLEFLFNRSELLERNKGLPIVHEVENLSILADLDLKEVNRKLEARNLPVIGSAEFEGQN